MAKPWEKYAATSAPAKPWEKYGGTSVPVESDGPGQLESGLRGAAQGASLGFADEAAGALSNLSRAWTDPNSSLFDTENYAKVRDAYRQGDAAAKRANPNTYLAGNLAGGAALPVGPLGVGKAALLGATQGLGNSEADTVGGLAKDTGLGATVGGVIGGLGSLVGKGVDKVSGLASDAVEGAGNYLKQGAEGLADKATGSSFGREALDEGVLKFGDNARNIAGRAKGKIDDLLGEEITPDALQKIKGFQGIQKGTADAAEKQAGGLLSPSEWGAVGAATVGGGIPAGLTAAGGIAGKNLAQPRALASGAVALDKVGDILTQAPETFGKFAAPLKAAQARGALSPTFFILQQTNPEFRQMVMGKEDQ